jgi:hypothetical protein
LFGDISRLAPQADRPARRGKKLASGVEQSGARTRGADVDTDECLPHDGDVAVELSAGKPPGYIGR